MVTKFFIKVKYYYYELIVANMIEMFKNQGRLMRLKVHYLHRYLDFFSKNLGDVTKKQEEWAHHNIKKIEKLYQIRCNIMIRNCSWSLH